MIRYLLDTNICIHFIKGQFNVHQKIDVVGVEQCFISEITFAELFYGVANGAPEKLGQNLWQIKKLRGLFSGQIICVENSLQEFGVQRAHLKRIGRLGTDMDILIGASAIANNLTLVTRNTKDFINMKGISLENWIDAP